MREFGPETNPVRKVGILKGVHKSTGQNHCYLLIKYNGSRYVGIIQCENQDFCEKLYYRFDPRVRYCRFAKSVSSTPIDLKRLNNSASPASKPGW